MAAHAARVDDGHRDTLDGGVLGVPFLDGESVCRAWRRRLIPLFLAGCHKHVTSETHQGGATTVFGSSNYTSVDPTNFMFDEERQVLSFIPCPVADLQYSLVFLSDPADDALPPARETWGQGPYVPFVGVVPRQLDPAASGPGRVPPNPPRYEIPLHFSLAPPGADDVVELFDVYLCWFNPAWPEARQQAAAEKELGDECHWSTSVWILAAGSDHMFGRWYTPTTSAELENGYSYRLPDPAAFVDWRPPLRAEALRIDRSAVPVEVRP